MTSLIQSLTASQKSLPSRDPVLERGQLPDQPAPDDQDHDHEQAALEAAERPGSASGWRCAAAAARRLGLGAGGWRRVPLRRRLLVARLGLRRRVRCRSRASLLLLLLAVLLLLVILRGLPAVLLRLPLVGLLRCGLLGAGGAAGPAAQRVLARVEVLDLRLLVAVAGGLHLVLPGVRVLRRRVRPDADGTGGIDRGRDRRPARPPGSAAGACGSTLVAAFGSYGPGVARQHLGGVGRAGRRLRDRRRAPGRARAARPPRAPPPICAGMACTPDAGRDRAQRAGRGSRRWAARSGSLAQAALYDRPQRLGHGGGAARLLAEVPVQHFERGAAGERRTAGDQLVQQDAGAVDVDGGGLRAALGGLRRDVRGRADELVGAGEAGESASRAMPKSVSIGCICSPSRLARAARWRA